MPQVSPPTDSSPTPSAAEDSAQLHVCDVAEHILKLTAPADGAQRITTWKLQKLVYYAQAWSLVWGDTPLFGERIEAWANGPVCPALYERHRGMFLVKQTDIRKNPQEPDASQTRTIEAVVDGYGELSGETLSALTHMESPWRDAREGVTSGKRSSAEITTESMQAFYATFSVRRSKRRWWSL